MIIITGQVALKPEQRDEAFRIGCEHSARSRAEPGCISHDCYADAEDANRMHFFERWEDMAAVQKHFAVPDSGMFMREIGALAASEPELAIYAAEPVDPAR
ncbi:putative quinol monooxygenase [Altererythrobacter sp. MF3-039]|uniref:putative quinol monooxygenase n=1 Tax=Altererythrobacter sp. MF3-039 TaxID=3252901 RepID=UPI00390C74E8